MSNKINWDDGSFEFIDEDALKKINTKKYAHSACPLANCKVCVERNCSMYRDRAAEASRLIFDRYFNEDTDDVTFVLTTLEKLPNDLKTELGLVDGKFSTCVAVHLLQKIDEETMIDASDELIQKAIKILLQ